MNRIVIRPTLSFMPRVVRLPSSASLALALWLVASSALAVPGPDSVAVLANSNVPGSLALARRYADLRDVPRAQVCVAPMSVADTITLAQFEAQILVPLRACLGEIEPRIEAVVVMRGVPLRVTIPVDGGRNVSVTAAIATWRSTLSDGTPLLGTAPGHAVSCGGTSSCYAARVVQPWDASDGAFVAGFTHDINGIRHAPVLATMLNGRTDDDAGLLLDAAAAAEAGGTPAGEFVLMNGADSARDALDSTYARVAAELGARGATVSIVPFDGENFIGHQLAGFAVGTSRMGATVEANAYVRGALVDNLTSFGAVPPNLAPGGETQVSIARWVEAGVAGVHGTVSEPLNNSFPSREFLVRYLDGATLAESFIGSLPFAYWLNLVLGDPMLAPYAQRPTVAIDGASDGDTLTSATMLSITATPPDGRAIARLSLLVDGTEVASAVGPTLDHCLAIATGEHAQILAVATTAAGADGTPSPWPAKGWLSIHVDEMATSATCGLAAPDAGSTHSGMSDAGTTAQTDASRGDAWATEPPPPSTSCGCSTSTNTGCTWSLVLVAVWLASRRRASSTRSR